MSGDDPFGLLQPSQPEPEREPRPDREPRSRTPLVLGIIAAVLFVAVVVTLAIALTRPPAATPTPTTPPATSAPVTTTPSPTPTADAATEPVALQLSGTGFALVDEAGDEVFTYAWADDAAAAVTALTDAFGAAPTTRVEPGDGTHYPDYTVYQWDGFMLFDMVETAGGTPRAEYAQPSYVLFSRNEIGGISLAAEHGLKIGMTVDAVRALSPDQEIPRGTVGAIRFVFDQARSSAEGPLQYSVFADTDGTVVTAVLYFRYSDL